MEQVVLDYKKLIGHDMKEVKPIQSRDFIGFSSITLERKNVMKLPEGMNVPNVREMAYTVTEKADGERKLLFVAENGKVYLIDTNMNFQYTGTKCEEMKGTIIDGEHVTKNKMGDNINLYLCFDIYYIKGRDVRLRQLVSKPDDKNKSRIQFIDKFIQNGISYTTGTNKFEIRRKEFFGGVKGDAIFGEIGRLLEKEERGEYMYETDGLIFTPAFLAVGTSKEGEAIPKVPRKTTWLHTFKWKPPEFNTVDFLVTTMKRAGKDIIRNKSDGDMSVRYKTIQLRVGFDERKHGYINPCEDILQDKFVRAGVGENYIPAVFHPSNPEDPRTHQCNIEITRETDGNRMKVEESTDVFENGTIVEFKYDALREDGWKWIPIRVRHDKTSAYRNGEKNYGNAYHVADSVWTSIHYPVTPEMLKTGIISTDTNEDGIEEVYYRGIVGRSSTQALRDFHNLYVKRRLLMKSSKPGMTLVDLAVGRGGDIPKWIASKLSFVFGVDIARDNIHNRIGGACARYLNYKKQVEKMPYALFAQADSGKNLIDGEAFFTDKGRQMMRAILGTGEKDEAKLGRGLYRQYGVGKEGFDIVSCQFALHYFFKDDETLDTFLSNVSALCKSGGVFVATCYDGEKVNDMLKEKSQGESVNLDKNGQRVWGITKEYEDDPTSSKFGTGYAIDVYQESINKLFREYLVSYPFLVEKFRQYGFEPEKTGMFKELYRSMMREKKLDDYKMAKNLNKEPERLCHI